jgi:hypothetical protein
MEEYSSNQIMPKNQGIIKKIICEQAIYSWYSLTQEKQVRHSPIYFDINAGHDTNDPDMEREQLYTNQEWTRILFAQRLIDEYKSDKGSPEKLNGYWEGKKIIDDTRRQAVNKYF